jgi:hypothetical protein
MRQKIIAIAQASLLVLGLVAFSGCVEDRYGYADPAMAMGHPAMAMDRMRIQPRPNIGMSRVFIATILRNTLIRTMTTGRIITAISTRYITIAMTIVKLREAPIMTDN